MEPSWRSAALSLGQDKAKDQVVPSPAEVALSTEA
jgi:hypothetical protein